MNETFKDLAAAVMPALKAAAVRAAKVAAYLVLSAGLAATEAWLSGRTGVDPMTVVAINLGVAALRRAVEELRAQGADAAA